MKAEQVLFSQGFGTRHECVGIIANGRFKENGELVTDPYEEIDTPLKKVRHPLPDFFFVPYSVLLILNLPARS